MTIGEHTNERTYVRSYVRTGQTLYPLHNFLVREDNTLQYINKLKKKKKKKQTIL